MSAEGSPQRPPLLRRSGVIDDGRRWLIRPSSGDDASALVGLRDAVAAEGRWVAAVPGERSALEEGLLIASLLAGGDLALTLELAGEVTGQCLVTRRRGRYEGHVGDLSIALAPGARGRGLGRALLETAVDWGRAVALGKICLAVFPWNRPALALYESAGFVEEGRQRRQVEHAGERHDVVLMGLLLDG